MSEKAQTGDTVQLARKEGIFIDYETGFEVSNAEQATLGDPIGKATNLAIQSGGLLIISEGKPKGKAKK